MTRQRWPLAPLYPEQTISQRQAECLITLLTHPHAERQELAKRLSISPRTFDTHTHALRKVFGCKRREQLLTQAALVDWKKWNIKQK